VTATDRLSSLDAGFLHLENDTQPMHVGSVLLFEGPAPDYQDFCDYIEFRLDSVPRYRQRVRRMPLDVARPIWVDDQHFSLAYHLRHTAIPQPGSEEQLRLLAGRVMGQRLDLDRPLWEIWLVEGLRDGRWAIISKVHHAMIDGISGNDLLEIVLTRDPAASDSIPPSTWRARAEPSRVELAAAGLAWSLRLPGELGHAAVGVWRSPLRAARAGAIRAYGLAQLGRTAARPTSVLNGPLGPHRRWGWARADLADVKAVKNAAGCTVNDVVLAAVAGGFRSFLLARGEPVGHEVIRSLVPVSIREPHEHGRLGNKVTAMFAELPVGSPDPAERLRAVARQLDRLKSSGMAVGFESMVAAADFVPPTLMVLGARVSTVVGQRVVNTVTTNIPGPQYPLYLLGHRLLEMFPYIPIGQGIRISIGIVSYDGHLAIGVTGDYEAVPDLDRLCEEIETSLAELVATFAPE